MGAQCTFIERNGQQVASWYHRYYTFTLAIVHCCRLELPFPPCTTVHTMCSHSRSKYLPEKMFRWRNIFVVEQYSSNTFLDNECHPKIFPLQKTANYGSITPHRRCRKLACSTPHVVNKHLFT